MKGLKGEPLAKASQAWYKEIAAFQLFALLA